MALSFSRLRAGLKTAARHTLPAAGLAAQAKAYTDYARQAQCCAGATPVTTDFPARQRALVAALKASAVDPHSGHDYALRTMAVGFAAFWMLPTPVVFPGPGAVTAANAAALYGLLTSALLPDVADAAAGGGPDGATSLAEALDAWTRTVLTAVPSLPCAGPLF